MLKGGTKLILINRIEERLHKIAKAGTGSSSLKLYTIPSHATLPFLPPEIIRMIARLAPVNVCRDLRNACKRNRVLITPDDIIFAEAGWHAVWGIEHCWDWATDYWHRDILVLYASDVSRWTRQDTLLDAVRKNDRVIIDSLIRAGAKVNGPVLGRAAEYYPEIVKYLLTRKVESFTERDLDAIEAGMGKAIKKSHMEAVKLLVPLIAADDDRAEDAFLYACYAGNIDIVRAAINSGINVNVGNDTPIHSAVFNGHAEIVQILLQAGATLQLDDDPYLSIAVSKNHIDVVRILLQSNLGGNIHAENDLALRLAASKGYTEVVQLLIEAGADVHAQQDTAIIIAVRNGHVGVVRALIQGGADVHVRQEAPLYHAVSVGQLEVMEVLLEAGANPRIDEGCLLYTAVNRGRPQILQRLLKAGVNSNLRGGGAVMTASGNGHSDIVKVLLDGGAESLLVAGALIIAAYAGSAEMVKMLLAPAMPKARPISLYGAALKGHVAVVEVVLATILGEVRELRLRDAILCFALEQARKEGHDAVVDILLKAGAVLNPTDSQRQEWGDRLFIQEDFDSMMAIVQKTIANHEELCRELRELKNAELELT
ncbi:hypothetical protein HDV00_000332 [Rhizophlyctis rosea]|nr:hypothetical protein HDV00_000332 [Rhizophlyctis rosea]